MKTFCPQVAWIKQVTLRRRPYRGLKVGKIIRARLIGGKSSTLKQKTTHNKTMQRTAGAIGICRGWSDYLSGENMEQAKKNPVSRRPASRQFFVSSCPGD